MINSLVKGNSMLLQCCACARSHLTRRRRPTHISLWYMINASATSSLGGVCSGPAAGARDRPSPPRALLSLFPDTDTPLLVRDPHVGLSETCQQEGACVVDKLVCLGGVQLPRKHRGGGGSQLL